MTRKMKSSLGVAAIAIVIAGAAFALINQPPNAKNVSDAGGSRVGSGPHSGRALGAGGDSTVKTRYMFPHGTS